MSKELEFWFTCFCTVGLIVQGAFWIIFAQFTMRRIEKQIETAGFGAGYATDYGFQKLTAWIYDRGSN